MDILDGIADPFDLIYTTRCLINLPAWDLQKNALGNIYKALNAGGVYVMIENYLEDRRISIGSEGIINCRKFQYESTTTSLPASDCFEYTNDLFDVEEELNISSTYYLVQPRCLLKDMCWIGSQPNYFDVHHQ